jgi:hypothetical protein
VKEVERKAAIVATIRKFPDLIDYYIRSKEDRGDEAVTLSDDRVEVSETLFVQQIHDLTSALAQTSFYKTEPNSYEAALKRAHFLKDAIENKGCHRIFYCKGKPIERESDLQVLYRLTWYNTSMDVTREANDGRGPADYKISRGAKDKSLVEMKLASNTQLERNLKKQTDVYQRASDASRTVKIIIYFSAEQKRRVDRILKALKASDEPSIVVIDARSDNKPSGSKA